MAFTTASTNAQGVKEQHVDTSPYGEMAHAEVLKTLS